MKNAPRTKKPSSKKPSATTTATAQVAAGDASGEKRQSNYKPVGFAFAGLKEPVEYAPGKFTKTADVFGISSVQGKELKLYGEIGTLMEFASKEGRFEPSVSEDEKTGKTRTGLPNASLTRSQSVPLDVIRQFTGEQFPIFATPEGGKPVSIGSGHYSDGGSIVLQFNSKAAEVLPKCKTYNKNDKGEERVYLSARNPSHLRGLKQAAEKAEASAEQ